MPDMERLFLILVISLSIFRAEWSRADDPDYFSENDYHVFGLQSDASAEEVHNKWRKLSKFYHPDRVLNNPDKRALHEEILKSLNNAWDRISAKQPSMGIGSRPITQVDKILQKFRDRLSKIHGNSGRRVSSIRAAVEAIREVIRENQFNSEDIAKALKKFMSREAPLFRNSGSATFDDLKDLYRTLREHRAKKHFSIIYPVDKNFKSKLFTDAVTAYYRVSDTVAYHLRLGLKPLDALAEASKIYFGDYENVEDARLFPRKGEKIGFRKYLKQNGRRFFGINKPSSRTLNQITNAILEAKAIKEYELIIILNRTAPWINDLVESYLKISDSDTTRTWRFLESVYGPNRAGRKLIQITENLASKGSNLTHLEKIGKIAASNNIKEESQILGVINLQIKERASAQKACTTGVFTRVIRKILRRKK